MIETVEAGATDPTREQARRNRIAPLDALRGTAAISVVFYHLGLAHELFSGGYLAVDFFFVLSGFVLGHAYDERLQNDLTAGAYVWIRIKRLWPMILVGAILGAAVSPLMQRDAYWFPPGTSVPYAFLAEICLVPFVASSTLFPLNPPQWSIFFELMANAVHALFARWLSTSVLTAIVATCAVAICVIVALPEHTIGYGWGAENFAKGIPRVGFSFFAGLLLFRTRTAWEKVVPSLSATVLMFAMLIMLGTPITRPVLQGVRDLAAVLVFSPALVVLGARSFTKGRWVAALGLLSYPLYLVHWPIIQAAHFVVSSVQEPGWLLRHVPVFAMLPTLGAALLLGQAIEPTKRSPDRANPLPV